MTSWPPNLIYDYLSPTPSYMLNLTLADFIPSSCYPRNYRGVVQHLPLARQDVAHDAGRQFLPPGHHLVYFAAQVSAQQLLADGTDALHSPGPPWECRLWAGGSLHWNTFSEYQPELDGTRAACIERIVDVQTKGPEGQEKVFVTIERRVGVVESGYAANERHVDDAETLQRFASAPDDVVGDASLVEMRNLVFMRPNPAHRAAQRQKILKPTKRADYSFSLVPTPSLLFRFSALTFNAHLIHLDREYCRAHEGHDHLLVHGPLTLVLMLSALQSRLDDGEMIASFEYRNLAPLYCGEELKVCVRRPVENPSRSDVWIEASHGGYAVKATATIERLSM